MCERKTLFMKFALKAIHSDYFLKMKVEVMLVWKLMDLQAASLSCFVYFAPRNHLTSGYESFVPK